MAELTGDTLYNLIKKSGLVPHNVDGSIMTSSNSDKVGGKKFTLNSSNTPNNITVAEGITSIFDRTLPTRIDPNVDNPKSTKTVHPDTAYQQEKSAQMGGEMLVINYKNNIAKTSNETTNGRKNFYNILNKPASRDEFNKFDGGVTPNVETIVNKTGSVGKALELKYADFLYCKKLNAYPNNRLVILRRFVTPVEDNIIDCESSLTNLNQDPLSVLITWFDEFPMSISFKEKWTPNKSGMMQAINEVSEKLSGQSSEKIDKDENATDPIKNPFLSSLWYAFLAGISEEEFEKTKDILPGANPNLIKESVYREAASLESTISFELKFEYVLRYINGIDPHMAMHNIIANIIRMGTSTSITAYPPLDDTSKIKKIYLEVSHGKVLTAINDIFTTIKDYLAENPGNTITRTMKSFLDKISNALSTNNGVADIVESFTAKVMSIFRFKLVAALQADTGMPSGQWHITVGNPFNPIVTVGDLVLDGDVSLSFNKELSYNDFPTEITASVKLKSARSRGAQELEQIFNNGFGRIYMYPYDLSNPDYFIGEIANTTDCNTNLSKMSSLSSISNNKFNVSSLAKKLKT